MLIATMRRPPWVRQPAQALERELELAHALRDRHVQRGQRRPAEHAVGREAVAGLEAPDAFGERRVVDRPGPLQRLRWQIAKPPQSIAQGVGVGVGVARPKRRLRHRERDCGHVARKAAIARKRLAKFGVLRHLRRQLGRQLRDAPLRDGCGEH